MHRPTAFTLIEMLAATALAGLLTLAALAVMRSVQHPFEAKRVDRHAPPMDDVLALLRWDLGQAVSLRQDSSGLLLAGFGSLDPATLEPTQRPVAVRYRFRRVNGVNWLLRDQQPLDGGPSAESQLVAAGLTGIELTAVERPLPLEEEPTVNTAADGASLFRALHGMSPVPDCVQVQLISAGRPTVQAIVFTR